MVHLDTDFLVRALSAAGPQRTRLLEVIEAGTPIGMSAVAWYELSRGPRTPEQLSVARSLFARDGIVPFSEEIAASAAEAFRGLGSPRRRAADVAIGVTAASREAVLLTCNANDFAGIPGLKIEAVPAD